MVGVVLALSRSFVIEAGTAFDPEQAMLGAVRCLRCGVELWYCGAVGGGAVRCGGAS